MLAWLRRWHVLHDWEVRFPSAFDLVTSGWREGRTPRAKRYTCRRCGLVKRYEEIMKPVGNGAYGLEWERLWHVGPDGQLAREYDPAVVEAQRKLATQR